jgi:glycine/D-amino acid oxidase-like deaminating enzyme
MLPARELAQVEPGLTPPADLDAFVYYAQEGYMNPAELMGLLARRAREAGVEIRTGTAVTEVLVEGDRAAGVVDATGTRHEADRVVLCAGNAVPDLLHGLGLHLPMASTVGMVAVTSPSPAGLRTVFHNEELSMRPDGAGRLMLRNWDFDAMVTTETPEEPLPSCTSDLLARAVKVLPELTGSRIELARIGKRPIPGDQLPVVGYVPGVEGLYAMVSHGAITHGALMGRLAAREILHGDRDERLADFSPERIVTTASAVQV